MRMRLIPAGEFLMGDHHFFDVRVMDHERPVHAVYLGAYWIDETEVTNEQYCAFLNNYGKNEDAAGHQLLDVASDYCLIEEVGNTYRPKVRYEKHPVIRVSWYGAAAYAQWVGAKLPTEAQWEKAARGGLVGKIYPWGYGISRDDANYVGTVGDDRDSFADNIDRGSKDLWDRTSPVRSFAPNDYGLYDMAGNALEWCADEYNYNYYSNSPANNPKGPGTVITFTNNDFTNVNVASWRVLRGGSGRAAALWLRCAGRYESLPSKTGSTHGFRCAVACSQERKNEYIKLQEQDRELIEEEQKKTVIRKDSTEMVLIPAGEFQMGDYWNESRVYERPVHAVYLDAFLIDKYEVTNAQFQKFLQANPQWQKNRINRKYHDGWYLKDWSGMNYPQGKANHPVVYISWYAAAAYAQWTGKRLPTEAEWEKAARGGLPFRRYPGGNDITDDDANGIYTGGRDIWNGTSPVGSFPPNDYGLFDMAGNVWEWCLDWYRDDFYATSPYKNPTGPNSRTQNVLQRVVRGGSWTELSPELRCACRGYFIPLITTNDLGFRCVQDVNP